MNNNYHMCLYKSSVHLNSAMTWNSNVRAGEWFILYISPSISTSCQMWCWCNCLFFTVTAPPPTHPKAKETMYLLKLYLLCHCHTLLLYNKNQAIYRFLCDFIQLVQFSSIIFCPLEEMVNGLGCKCQQGQFQLYTRQVEVWTAYKECQKECDRHAL